MAEKDQEETKKKKQAIRGKRSPNYPNINLQKAIGMISDFYEKFQRNAVPAPLAMEAMGYSITSGQAQSMLASLSYYDLVQVERGPLLTKKVNITAKGFTILKNPNATEKNKAIQEAALSPAIFKKLRSKFPNQFPQESLLAWELEITYGFNPKTIPGFIVVFKQTMDYAKIYESGIIEDKKEAPEDHKTDGKEDKEVEKTLLNPPPTKNYIPGQGSEIAKYRVDDNITISLVSTGPLSAKAIEKLIKHLAIDWEDINVEIKTSKPSNNDES